MANRPADDPCLPRPCPLVVFAGWIVLLLITPFGCSTREKPIITDRIILFVPGVAGDGAEYNGLYQALRQTDQAVEIVSWGAPKALFFKNFSDEKIHQKAESQLAERLQTLPASVQQIDLVGHSAGCGVILGAVAISNRRIETIILLAPSVSPGYDLRPALSKVDDKIHVFYSDRDSTFLNWRTKNFGTYDRIKTAAAGNTGFDLSMLNVDQRNRIHQQAYQVQWESIGNDGGHWGAVNGKFAAQIISPLLRKRNDPR